MIWVRQPCCLKMFWDHLCLRAVCYARAYPTSPAISPSQEAAFPPPCAKAAWSEGGLVHSFQLLVPIVWKRSRFSWEGSPVSVSVLGVFLG